MKVLSQIHHSATLGIDGRSRPRELPDARLHPNVAGQLIGVQLGIAAAEIDPVEVSGERVLGSGRTRSAPRLTRRAGRGCPRNRNRTPRLERVRSAPGAAAAVAVARSPAGQLSIPPAAGPRRYGLRSGRPLGRCSSTFSGTVRFDGSAILRPDGNLIGSARETLNGTVADRSGTVVCLAVVKIARTGSISGSFTVLSGTGGLAGVHGSGTFEGSSVTPTSAVGTYAGRFVFVP